MKTHIKKTLIHTAFIIITISIISAFMIVYTENTKKDIESCAIKEISTLLNKEYGEKPICIGNIVSSIEGKYSVVIVRFYIPGINHRGSFACLIHGSKHPVLCAVTKEFDFNYNYSTDELKAVWLPVDASHTFV